MKKQLSCEDRLKSIIVLDKQDYPQKLNRLIKAEILYVLRNYFDISSEDMLLDISVNEYGKYKITFEGECRNVKIAHVFEK